MQDALCRMDVKRVALSRGVYQALTYFRWLTEDLIRLPTILCNLVLLQPKLDIYHNSSGHMCEGAVLPGTTTVPRTSQPHPSAAAISPDTMRAHPIVWLVHILTEITYQLISRGQVTNSDLELAGRVLHHTYMTDCFDIHKRTMLSHTDNTAGI